MKIVVAGAGAGKTTSMAQQVLDRYKIIEQGKIIYIITYTNAAKNQIRNKIIELHGAIPDQVKIETSHSFLLQEIIFPFNHLLYDQLYTKTSIITLPSRRDYRAVRIKELKKENIVHAEEVTQIAKFVLVGKTSDKKELKEKRRKILMIIARYLDSLFIDEVQDIDENLSKIIEVLHTNHINLHLVGDPKQDLRGRNELRMLVEKYDMHVEYKEENYRCPISHVNYVNQYVPKKEAQKHQTTELGVLEYQFESEINLEEFIQSENYCHKYIYQRNERFTTNIRVGQSNADLLKYELKRLIMRSQYAEDKPDNRAYRLNKRIQRNIHSMENWKIIDHISRELLLKLTSQDKARLQHALNLSREKQAEKRIEVESIDKVKGLEGERCLFILSVELAGYLFLEKTQTNKMLNYLYVALTRSKNTLTILITEEVEEKYGKEWITEKMSVLFKINEV